MGTDDLAVHRHSLDGFLHEFGIGVERNLRKADQMYALGARCMEPFSIARLSFLRRHGRPHIQIDREEARAYRQALVAGLETGGRREVQVAR